MCKNHNFCNVEQQKEFNDTKEIHAVPFAYDSLVKDVTLKDFGMKVVVSDYGLAHWLAANNGYNINDFPVKKD